MKIKKYCVAAIYENDMYSFTKMYRIRKKKIKTIIITVSIKLRTGKLER